jgi:hypothetical protein
VRVHRALPNQPRVRSRSAADAAVRSQTRLSPRPYCARVTTKSSSGLKRHSRRGPAADAQTRGCPPLRELISTPVHGDWSKRTPRSRPQSSAHPCSKCPPDRNYRGLDIAADSDASSHTTLPRRRTAPRVFVASRRRLERRGLRSLVE